MTGTASILPRTIAALTALLLAAGLFAWMNATGDAINDSAAAVGALKHPSQTPWTLNEFPGPYDNGFMFYAGVGSVLFAGAFASVLMLGVDVVATYLSRGWLAWKSAWSGTRHAPTARNYSRRLTARAFLAGLWALPALVVVANSPALWRPRLEIQIDETFGKLWTLEILAELAARRMSDDGGVPTSLEYVLPEEGGDRAQVLIQNGYSYTPVSGTTARFCAAFPAAIPAGAARGLPNLGCFVNPPYPFDAEISEPGHKCFEVDLTIFKPSARLCH